MFAPPFRTTFFSGFLPTFVSSSHRWTKPCAAAALLAAGLFAVASNVRAQATPDLRTIGTFNGATGKQPNQALTIGSDGNFYGTAPEGGAGSTGTLYRVTPSGSITLLYSFGSYSSTSFPNCKLVLANDGNLYGTGTASTDKGTSPGDFGTNVGGVVFQITPAGNFRVLHTFNRSLTPAPARDTRYDTNGGDPETGLIQGSDGALYGTTQSGGNATIADPTGDGTIFRIALDGTAFTVLHRFDFNQTGAGGYKPNTPLVQGSDGNFYGVTAQGGDDGLGVIYQMTPAGVVTNIHSFNGQDGSGPVGPLVEGESGVFYGITTTGSRIGHGTFFSVTTGGTLKVLHYFTETELGTPQTGVQQSGLIKALDGNFYLTVAASGNAKSSILQLTPAGNLTVAYQFNSSSLSSAPTGALVQTDDGSFYGTTSGGGVSGNGTVFRFALLLHPPFFDGYVDLSNGVEYLSFPNGNYFGYFSFLSDPHYIFHQDMGFEYVFDAADGNSGVYLYDFQSGHFFYTSPIFPFPYLYDFTLNTVLYYYPDSRRPGRYNTNEVRYFYDFALGKIIRL